MAPEKLPPVLRYLETFYQHRLRLLAPVCLVLLVSAGVTIVQPAHYTSTVRLWVDRQTALGAATSSDNNPYLDISQLQANTLSELLKTRYFCIQVGQRSHLSEELAVRPISPGLLSQLRSKVHLGGSSSAQAPTPGQVDDMVYNVINGGVLVIPSGTNIVDITFAYAEPAMAAAVAQGVVDQFLSEMTTSRKSQGQAAADFYATQAKKAQADQAATSGKVFDYLAAHPELRPDSAVPDARLIQLRRDDDAARQRYDSIRNKLDQASIDLAGLEAPGASGFRILDKAAVPTGATLNRKLLLQVLGAGAGLGLALLVAGLILLTLIDTTLRSPEEVEGALGLRLVGSVPRLRSLRA